MSEPPIEKIDRDGYTLYIDRTGGGRVAYRVPQGSPLPPAIERKLRPPKQRRTAPERCARLGAARKIDGRVDKMKVLCATCKGNTEQWHAVHECELYGRCLPTFRPKPGTEAYDQWHGNEAKGIEPRFESTLYHLCDGCPSYQPLVQIQLAKV